MCSRIQKGESRGGKCHAKTSDRKRFLFLTPWFLFFLDKRSHKNGLKTTMDDSLRTSTHLLCDTCDTCGLFGKELWVLGVWNNHGNRRKKNTITSTYHQKQLSSWRGMTPCHDLLEENIWPTLKTTGHPYIPHHTTCHTYLYRLWHTTFPVLLLTVVISQVVLCLHR